MDINISNIARSRITIMQSFWRVSLFGLCGCSRCLSSRWLWSRLFSGLWLLNYFTFSSQLLPCLTPLPALLLFYFKSLLLSHNLFNYIYNLSYSPHNWSFAMVRLLKALSLNSMFPGKFPPKSLFHKAIFYNFPSPMSRPLLLSSIDFLTVGHLPL